MEEEIEGPMNFPMYSSIVEREKEDGVVQKALMEERKEEEEEEILMVIWEEGRRWKAAAEEAIPMVGLAGKWLEEGVPVSAEADEQRVEAEEWRRRWVEEIVEEGRVEGFV